MQPDRHRHILATLRRDGQVAITTLARELDVSPLTIRRDLQALHAGGRLVRTHGGAVTPDFLPGEASFERKRSEAGPAKTRLGRIAAALSHDAGAVFVDAGTTTLETGLALLRGPGPLVYTHSIPLLVDPSADGRVVSLGGTVRTVSLALVGAGVTNVLASLAFDVAFIGASGVHPTQGPATTEPLEAAIKREVLARSRRRVLVLDGGKWSRSACVCFARWTDFTDVVTEQIPAAFARRLRSHGIVLHLPPTGR